jgi:outer membrane biosynthesis protein TonB
MREPGIPQVLTWRWAPCIALALGAISFAAFAMLAIPERIGDVGSSAHSTSASMTLDNGFATTQPSPSPPGNWNDNPGVSSRAVPNGVTQVASRAGDLFPKRGFTPPLERPEPPPAPPTAIPPPPVQLDAPPQVAPQPAAPQQPAASAETPTPVAEQPAANSVPPPNAEPRRAD